jgi:conjugative relaxase-like TrwC/TraI family protein
MEAFAAARIRTGGQQNDRFTGNLVAALFTHDTSRALDPHLHTHCIVLNATFDQAEHRWKALQNYELLRAKKFAENAYYHELSRELRSLGYRIRNRARGDFQVEGVSEELCDRFSKRDAEIDRALAKLLSDNQTKGANIGVLQRNWLPRDEPGSKGFEPR